MKKLSSKFLALIFMILALCTSAQAAIMIGGSSTVILLPEGNIDAEYSQTLSVDAETALWSVSSGTLPPGLTLDSDGTISGTPTTPGVYTFTVQAEADDETYTQILTLVVLYPEIISPDITTESLTGGYANSPYGFKLTASGSVPMTWSADNLPEGMTLTSWGYLYGTPQAAGTYSFTVQASNSAGTDTKSLSLSVAEPPAETPALIEVDDIDPAVAGSEYMFQLRASGTPPIKWIVKGTFPAGLSISDTGLITKVSSKKGTSVFTIIASNDFGASKKTFKLKTYDMPEITTIGLKDATVNRSYKETIKRKGSTPLTWTLEGTLPDGIEFDLDKGKFSGTPTTAGISMFRVSLSNSAGFVSKVYTLNVGTLLPRIMPNSLKKGTDGKAYKMTIKTKNGTEPITLSLEGTLPAGLSFDSDTGVIEGTPTETCTNRTIKITATNPGGKIAKNYSLTINAVPPKITTKELPEATINTPYSVQFEGTGTTPITWTATGLPSGLAISGDGLISGSPARYGEFRVRVTAKNEAKSVSKNYKLNVLSAPEFSETSSTLRSGKVGTSYKYEFRVNGSKTITYSITGGTLPSGISLNAKNGILKGKPKESGTFTFTVTAENSAGQAGKEFTMSVAAKTVTLKSTAPVDMNDKGAVTENESSTHQEGTYESVNVPQVIGDDSSDFVDGYVIAAVLPEISVDVSGMYDFSAEISPDIKEGAELVWLSGSSEKSNDDDIAEFFDESGREITCVPESRKVGVSAWLNAGKVYRPVIAVKQ